MSRFLLWAGRKAGKTCASATLAAPTRARGRRWPHAAWRVRASRKCGRSAPSGAATQTRRWASLEGVKKGAFAGNVVVLAPATLLEALQALEQPAVRPRERPIRTLGTCAGNRDPHRRRRQALHGPRRLLGARRTPAAPHRGSGAGASLVSTGSAGSMTMRTASLQMLIDTVTDASVWLSACSQHHD
jgi:hypothetical protein